MSCDVLQIVGSAKFTQLWCECCSFVCVCVHCFRRVRIYFSFRLQFWREQKTMVIFVFHSQTITDLSIQKIAETCLHLEKLCVSKCAVLTDHTLISLAQHNPYLSTLEVAGCHQFTDLGFQALGKVGNRHDWIIREIQLKLSMINCRIASIWNEWIWRSAIKSLI